MILPSPPKRHISLPALVALLSLMLILGGMCVSRSAAVTAKPMGCLIDATRHVRDSTDETPDIFFYAGVAVAALFILAYFWGMRVNDPFKRRRKSD